MPNLPASPPLDPEAIPDEAVLSRDKLSLRLTWRDGTTATLAARTLRLRCRCGWCTRDRLTDAFPAVAGSVAITRIEPMGGFAVHLAFSDGHARGIFPWTYLRDLSREDPLRDEDSLLDHALRDGALPAAGPARAA